MEDLEGPDDGPRNRKIKYKDIRGNVTWVVVDYEGSLFPGICTAVLPNSFQVKCLAPDGLGTGVWRFPSRDDKILYRPSSIHSIISVPTPVNKRGGLKVPELDNIWKC